MGPEIVLIVIGGLLGLILLGVVVAYLIVPVGRFIGLAIRNVFRFIGQTFKDAFRLIGAVFAGLFFVAMVLGNVVVGRWSAASHHGRALQNEGATMLGCLFRLVIGNPARLVGLDDAVKGVEERVPNAMAASPGPDKPGRRTGQFEGYDIVGSLPGGGSGGKLYVAEPDAIRRASFERAGQFGVGQVVIKTFSLRDGSSLPQIVRESRALEAAKKLGLVLDHEMTNERFFYVMRYVPGQSLSLAMQQLHASGSGEGLGPAGLRSALGYAADLLRTLDTYHKGGLWHKDVKPDNIIVDHERAHLVDFGLLTHLSSSMTLTTHGTEYFRDPELVRMALRGVKVHEVDGARFDLFAVGAVIYSMIENSFPAHGVLSPIQKRCPEALRWIVRRAMTDYDKRYASAAQMLLDIETLRSAADPFAVMPVDLPSMRQGGQDLPKPEVDPFVGAAAAAGARAASPVPPAAGATPGAQSAARAVAPKLRLVNWWTGRYEPVEGPRVVPPTPPTPAPWPPMPPEAEAVTAPVAHRVPPERRAPAHEQVARARGRAAAARERAQTRLHRRGRSATREFQAGPNRGVGVAVGALIALLAIVGVLAWRDGASSSVREQSFAAGRVMVTERAGAELATLGAAGEMDVDALRSAIADADDRRREILARTRESMLERLDEINERIADQLSDGREPGPEAVSERDALTRAIGSAAWAAAAGPTPPRDAEAFIALDPESLKGMDERFLAGLRSMGFATMGEDFARGSAQFREGFAGMGLAIEEGFAGMGVEPIGRAAMIIDLPSPLSAADRVVALDVLIRAKRAGIVLIGDKPGAENIASSTEDLDVSAGVRVAKGVFAPDSPDARSGLSGFLNAADDLDAILWVYARGEGSDRSIEYVVVGPELDMLAEPRRERTREVVRTLARVLAGENDE